MAESMAQPWILKHLLGIARTRGANIHDEPPLTKKRKIQITKFLTYPDNNQPNDLIWALVSDKQYELPAKFTAAAVTAYNSVNHVFGAGEDECRLTTKRYAIAVISDVKPFLGRVPLGKGMGMSEIENIALEVGSVSILGADHEGIFGNPANIETHEDIQEWVSGLKEGGGGGNVLKPPKKETAVAQVVSTELQTNEPPVNNLITPKESLEPRDITEPNTSVSNNGLREKTGANDRKTFLRKWKKVVGNGFRDLPSEAQLQHDQILAFGRERLSARRSSKRKSPYRWNSSGRKIRSDQEDASSKQEPEVAKATANKSGVAQIHNPNAVRTPLSSPVRNGGTNGSQKRDTAQSTPSVWEDSDDERERRKVREADEDDDSPKKTPSPSARRMCMYMSSGPPPPEREENAAEEDDGGEDDSNAADDESGDSEGNRNRSILSDEEGAIPTSFPAPTPAQRQTQKFGADSSLAIPRNRAAQLESSQLEASDLPLSIPISTFPYHASKNSRASAVNPGTSQAESCARPDSQQESSRTSQSQSNTRFLSHEDPESSAPRILVPDSDTSGRINSQPQSQSLSQSQSQAQPQSKKHPLSQSDSQPLPNTQWPPSRNSQRKQLSRSSDAPSRLRSSNNASQKNYITTAEQGVADARLPLFPSRSVNQSRQGPQSLAPQVYKRRIDQTSIAQTQRQPSSMTESHTQSESQPSRDDAPATLESNPETLANPTETSTLQPPSIHADAQASNQQQQSSSATLEDSQENRSEESSPAQMEVTSNEATCPTEPDTRSMDVDDARTHALIFGEPGHRSVRVENFRPAQELNVKVSAREAYRLSHVQGSPTTHLGKHPHSSSPTFRSTSSTAIVDDGNVHAVKKSRVSTSADSAAMSIVQRVVHDSKAWQSPSFLQRREKKGKEDVIDRSRTGEQQDVPAITSNDAGNKGKGKQRADFVSDLETVPSGLYGQPTGRQGALFEKLASISSTESSRNVDVPDARVARGDPKASDSSQAVLKKDTTQATRSKSKDTKLKVARISSSEASSSRVKLEEVDDGSLERKLLGGFSSDLTLHREPDGPQWLNWDDAMRILFNISSRDSQDSGKKL